MANRRKLPNKVRRDEDQEGFSYAIQYFFGILDLGNILIKRKNSWAQNKRAVKNRIEKTLYTCMNPFWLGFVLASARDRWKSNALL